MKNKLQRSIQNIFSYDNLRWHIYLKCAGIKLFSMTFFSGHAAQLAGWDLSSPTKDWTQDPAVKALSPNHWTPGNSLHDIFLMNFEIKRLFWPQ